MKYLKYLSVILSAIALLACVSCTSDATDDMVENKDGKCIYKMQFSGDMPGYNDDTTSRAAKSWTSGSKVYLIISSGSSKVSGIATYDGSSWSMEASSLTGSGTCTAVYIDNPLSANSTTVSTNGLSAIYTGSGNWSRSGATFTLNAKLSPKYGRIRMKGTSGTNVSLAGLTTCNAYNISSGSFTTTTSAVSTSIQSTGYTPYIYGSLTGTTLTTNGYTMTCPSTMMKAGDSGWVNYPTSSSHTGWE